MQSLLRQHVVCIEAEMHDIKCTQADLIKAYCSVGDSAGWPCGLDAIRHCFGPHFDCNPTAKKAKVSLSLLCPCSLLVLHICRTLFHTSTHHQVQLLLPSQPALIQLPRKPPHPTPSYDPENPGLQGWLSTPERLLACFTH